MARDRDLELQSAAVRILKARQEISHEELLNEIITMVTNRHAVKDQTNLVRHIKEKVFHFLLENDYMERHEDKKGVYLYIA